MNSINYMQYKNMTYKTNILCLAMAAIFGFSSSIHAWEPGSNWRDSYAIDGQCYCDSSNYDHDLDTKTARTPLGFKNVVEICDDLQLAIGSGSSDGRIPYNDIQCGNGPANNAADETGCPGRVDQGDAGCDSIGPRWNLEKVYGPWPESCSASRRLEQGQWYMISMPCDVQLAGKGSVREVLADDLGEDQLGTSWTMYELLDEGTYRELNLDSQLHSGVGYWLITSEVDKVIDIKGEYPIEVDVSLRSQNDTGAWNMIGTAFRFPVLWTDVKIVDSSDGEVMNIAAASSGIESCTSDPISSSCEVAPIAFKWTINEYYETLDLQSGELDIFDAAWVLAVKDGMRIRVPMP